MARIGFGAFYPHGTDINRPYRPRIGMGPGEFAQRLEQLGFDGFFTGESPTNRGPNYETFATLCFAAAATSRITVSSDVTLLPLHHPVWIAKEYGTLDVLSNGRAMLMVGVGGDGGGQGVKQFEGFGVPLSERGARANEGLDIIKSLWSQPETSYHGRFHNFDGMTMDPKPIQDPMPIWVGGRPGGTELGPDGQLRKKSATGAIRRAAKYGDGWNPFYMTTEMYRDSVTQIKDHAAELGRDISHMKWSLNTHWQIGKSYDDALDKAARKLRYGLDLGRQRIERYDTFGNPDDCIKNLEGFVAAGCNYFVCQWTCEPEEVIEHCEVISREIMPHFQK